MKRLDDQHISASQYNISVLVIFFNTVNFYFSILFWGMVMYDNEFKTKEEQKLTEIKKNNCNISMPMSCQKSH